MLLPHGQIDPRVTMKLRPAFTTTMRRGFLFLRAPKVDSDQQSRNLALNALYLGTLSIVLVAFSVVCANFVLLQLHYLGPRILVISALAVVMVTLYVLRRRHYRLASYGLLAFYFTAATGAVWLWGAQTPVGTLLFALVIIMAGILLGARYAWYALSVAILVLTTLTWLGLSGVIHPDTAWARMPAGFYDVATFAIILGNLALVSWLFNRSMERSLLRARTSERALRRQKELLEEKVEERTRQVQTAHFERVQEMYRFAELGHMSVGLLHDVANYLSVLSLDIEDLKQARRSRSEAVKRVQQSIRHLDSLIGQVRSQIKDESTPTTFNITTEIEQVIKLLAYKAAAQRVVVQLRPAGSRKQFVYTGSLNHFWQIITNLISNAIDAYHMGDGKQAVIIEAKHYEASIVITVTDHGDGISSTHIKRVFEPFYSSKKRGMGIGLAISKRMIEKDFGGSITVVSTPKQGTIFTVSFPTHEK